MELIGHVYETPELIRLSSGSAVIYKGIILETNELAYCETDLYYNRPLKSIPMYEKVEVIGTWCNLYGKYVKCKYNNEVYDINPDYLRFNIYHQKIN